MLTSYKVLMEHPYPIVAPYQQITPSEREGERVCVRMCVYVCVCMWLYVCTRASETPAVSCVDQHHCPALL